MATIPCTIVVFTQDNVNLPIDLTYLIMKQLFQYGVKSMRCSDDKVFISLSYSPKNRTLKRKFGNLPIRYMRVRVEDEDEFKNLEKVVLKYKFNLLDEELDEIPNASPKRLKQATHPRYLMPPNFLDEFDDDDDDDLLSNATTSVEDSPSELKLLSDAAAAAVSFMESRSTTPPRATASTSSSSSSAAAAAAAPAAAAAAANRGGRKRKQRLDVRSDDNSANTFVL